VLKIVYYNYFTLKNLGDLKYFLGIEFYPYKAGIYMSQRRKYALDILQDTRLSAHPNKFPMEQYLKLTLVIKGSSQIQATRGTTDIPHGYSTWHSIFGSDPKSIYTRSTETSLGCCNSSSKVHQRITRTKIAIAIRKQSDIDSLLRLRLGSIKELLRRRYFYKGIRQETVFDATTQVGVHDLHLPTWTGSIKEIIIIKLYAIIVCNIVRYCTQLYAINLIMIKSHD